MIPWVLFDSVQVPGQGEELRLYQRDDEFSIRIVGHGELMNSRVHGSEGALAELTCARLVDCPNPRLLIGGLGLGFTLAAALQHVGDSAQVVVAELVPAVVVWNRGPLGECAAFPLEDPRVTVREGDVARYIKVERNTYDAILLDMSLPDGNGMENIYRIKASVPHIGILRSRKMRSGRGTSSYGGCLCKNVIASMPSHTRYRQLLFFPSFNASSARRAQASLSSTISMMAGVSLNFLGMVLSPLLSSPIYLCIESIYSGIVK